MEYSLTLQTSYVILYEAFKNQLLNFRIFFKKQSKSNVLLTFFCHRFVISFLYDYPGVI